MRYSAQPGTGIARAHAPRQARPCTSTCRGGVVELIAPEDEEEHGALATQLGHPICLALVDASGSSDFLSVVQSALEAAVDAMPEGALLGVVTFSSSAGLYALAPASERPAARFVSLSIDDTATSPPSAVAFEDALALEHVLMTTGSGDSADRVRRWEPSLLSSLLFVFSLLLSSPPLPPRPILPPSRHRSLLDAVFTAIASNATPATASSAPVRAFGPALQAALRYLAEGAGPVLSSLHAKHGGQRGRTADPAAQGAVSFAGAQLLCFLSGPPNVGRGRTVGEDAGPKGGGKQGVTERARVFYSEAAIAAAALGVSVDVFAVAEDEEEIGLDCLEVSDDGESAARCGNGAARSGHRISPSVSPTDDSGHGFDDSSAAPIGLPSLLPGSLLFSIFGPLSFRLYPILFSLSASILLYSIYSI